MTYHNGKLNDHAYSQDNSKPLLSHPQTGFSFKGTVIPNFSEALEMVKLLHKEISPYFRFVAWDIAMNLDNRPTLVEVNLKYPGVMNPQLNCGPIFGSSTKKILREVKENKTL